jgi:hypothetical protein
VTRYSWGSGAVAVRYHQHAHPPRASNASEGRTFSPRFSDERFASGASEPEEEKVVVTYWNPIRPLPALRGSGWPPRKSSSMCS